MDSLAARYAGKGIDLVAGIEARGFIFGTAVAYKLGVGFIPIRKAGKLPGEVVGVDYQLEYGTDRMEMHADAVSQGDDVLLVDDLIATGGTASAAVELIRGVGGTVVEGLLRDRLARTRRHRPTSGPRLRLLHALRVRGRVSGGF